MCPTGRDVIADGTVRYYRAGAAIALAALCVIAFRAQRGLWFIADEWDVLAHYVDGHYFQAYNGHLSVVPVLIYQALAHSVGIGSYRPYGTIGIIVFAAIPITFALTHRRRVDERLVWVATVAIGWSWAVQMNLMYGFLINFDIPVVMLVFIWWAIRRDELSWDLWAIGALVVALASSSVGIIVAFAVLTELVLRRAAPTRIVRFAIPVAIWLAWWAFEREATTSATLSAYLSYAWDMTVAILAGFTWGWAPGAIPVAAGITAIVMIAYRRWHTLDAHVVATFATLVVFIALTTYSRAGQRWLNAPDSSRYVFLGDFLLIAALVWCVRDRPIRATAVAMAIVAAILGALPLVGHIGTYRDYVLTYQARTRPFLTEAETAGRFADPNRNLPLNLIPVTNGDYLHLVERVGSPILGMSQRTLGSPLARHRADALLVADEHVMLRDTTLDARACPAPPESIPPTGAEVRGGDRTLIISDAVHPVTIRLRRLASPGDGIAIGVVPPGGTRLLTPPRDRSARPWWIEPQVNVRICRLDGDAARPTG